MSKIFPARKFLFSLFLISFFLTPSITLADVYGQIKNFFVEPGYDIRGREKITARLEKICQNGYFYVEKNWYEGLTEKEKEIVNDNLDILATGFANEIYPKLTSIFGSEWKPGIDNDYNITVLFEQMKDGTGGYFDSGNEYSKFENPKSNEREMVYLNTETLFSQRIKSFLAHEFVHLITFNQKERLRGVTEEVWLNEARAEIAPTLIGYDNVYQGSNLQQRVNQFIASPSDSLTDWQNDKSDYGSINLFTQYLIDHYGVKVLSDSLKSSEIGIPSINKALKKEGYNDDFSRIFTDWTIANYLNDCQFGEKYCYRTDSLKNFRISPSLIFLPPTQKTEFSLNYSTPQWSGNWYRIIGGKGKLKIDFNGDDRVQFKVPYIICQDSQACQIHFLQLDNNQKGEILIDDFGSEWTNLTLIPLIQTKITGFDGKEPSFDFSISASMEPKNQEEKLIEQLKARIAQLKAQIIELQAKIAAILSTSQETPPAHWQGLCKELKSNLYYGMKNDDVVCLQQFLKLQGPNIYPQGLITGFFGPLTLNAVVRFQEKYASEILNPLGLEKGTGYVGQMTRAKINQLLNFLI